MANEQLRTVNLTTADFDLMIDALENSINRGLSSLMMSSLMGAVLIQDPDKQMEFERQSALKEAKLRRENDIRKEEIRLLQAKLIQLKRLLTEDNLMDSIK